MCKFYVQIQQQQILYKNYSPLQLNRQIWRHYNVIVVTMETENHIYCIRYLRTQAQCIWTY